MLKEDLLKEEIKENGIFTVYELLYNRRILADVQR